LRKIKIAIIILLILIIIGVVVFLGFQKTESETNNIDQQEISEEKDKFEVVENTAMYFTVESCVDTYINYIQHDEKVPLYKILDETYLQKNNITENTVLDNIQAIPQGSDLDIQKMLLVNGKEEDLQKYYVYGLLRNNNDQEINRKKMYLTVNIDIENMIFSIIPNIPDEEVFDE